MAAEIANSDARGRRRAEHSSDRIECRQECYVENSEFELSKHVGAVANALKEEDMTDKHERLASHMPDVAGNGLIDRRALLGRGMLFAGAAATGVGSSSAGAAAEPLPIDPWSMVPGER